MTDERSDDNQAHFDAAPSPKHHKKDTKRYVAFHSDEQDSSEVEEETPRKDRKKVKKDRSNTFRDKFKSIKVKKREKENKEKTKEKEKEEKKERKERKKHKRSLSAGDALSSIQVQSPPPVSPVFGVPIEVAVARSKLADGIELPTVFRECIGYLDEKGIDQEGIYRVSGIKSKIDELKSQYNHGTKVDLDAEDVEPNIVAGLLKLYLRELPVNILTAKLLPVFDSLVGLRDEAEQVDKMRQLLAELPTPNFTLLSWLFVHLDHVMAKNSGTKMGIQNISIVFSPTMNISHGVLFIIMTHIKEFFPDVKIIKYVEPVKPKVDAEVPHSPTSLEEELSKQEVFLDNLHQRMNTDGADEEEVMEQMWDIQRTVTQLKRRLKTIRKHQPPRENTDTDTSKADSEASEGVKVRHQSAEETSGANQRRDQMQLEIDQGKSKLQVLIKEESKARHPVEPEEDDPRKKIEQESARKEGKPVIKKRLAEYAKPDQQEKQEDAAILEQRKIEEARLQRRNEEHARILEKSKELGLHSPTDVTKGIRPKNEIKEEVKPKESVREDEEVVVEEAATEVVKSSDVDHEEADSVDDGLDELLREEHRLIIEQEELLSLGARLKDRIQREWNDVDRLQLEIDEMEKRENHTSTLSSSSDDGSSSDSSNSGSDSEGGNSDLEEILKELEKENEKLENQTVDLMKALSDERDRTLQLQVEIRMMEAIEI